VTEALGSPFKRQVSFEAPVTKVFDVVSGATWQHRDVMLSGVLRSVKVKFWNDHIPMVTCASNQNVRIKNLLVDEFRSERHMTVTDETVIEIGDADAESGVITFLWAM